MNIERTDSWIGVCDGPLALGLIYAYARRDNAAFEQFKKTLDMDSNFASAHGNLSGTGNGSLALRKMPNPSGDG